MNKKRIFDDLVSKKEFLLFAVFYIVSSIIFYTASWISWGGFKPGHPSYFTFEEYAASGGAQFLISFLVTIPIWYITSVILKDYSLKQRLLPHIIFLPIYIKKFICLFHEGSFLCLHVEKYNQYVII